MQCPRCNAEVAAGARFCTGCGAAVERKLCPGCQAEAQAGARFCVQCGHLLDATVAAASEGGVAEPEPRRAPEPPRTPPAPTVTPPAPPVTPPEPTPPPPPLPPPPRRDDPPRVRSDRSQRESPPERPRKRRGCLGWGCLVFTVFMLGVVFVVGVGAATYFRVPQRLGLVKSPAQRVLADTPDRVAAAALKADLAKAGIDLRGVDLYVLPMRGRDASVAIAVLDVSEGFQFDSTSGPDPVVDFLHGLADSKTVTVYQIDRVAIEYRGRTGESVAVFTVPTAAVSDFAGGRISRTLFLERVDGRADWVGLYREIEEVFQ